MYFCFISRLKSGTEISIRSAHYKTGHEPHPTVLTAKTLYVGTKEENKKKTTESVGNTTENGQENGGRWREMRDQKMMMSVIIIMIVMIRKRSNKQEKEKSSKGIIRQIGKCKLNFNP